MKLLVVSFLALVLVTDGAENAESVIPTKTEYERYLDQILLVFEKDPKVKEILKNATPQDIKNGVIERTLRRLHPDIRSKLDEVKRNIIMEYRQKLRRAKMDDKVPDDLYKFQDEDLKHLLKERHDRLAQMNEDRKKQFKKYEMEKELKHRMALRAMNEYDRKVQEALDEEEKKKKIDHAKKLKHPGNKAQLEEVWEAEGFDKGTFNPKTFFKMHDVNNDGEWDDFELEAIFEKEVEELFEGLGDVDEEEKDEEVSRMREHVIDHIDKDKDGVIQLKEFVEYANSQDFDHEDPWDAAFAAEFSEEDLDNFEKTLDEKEKEDVKAQAEVEKQRRLETIKKFEDESKINMQMLKEHSEKLKEALLAANKAKDLEKAKKLVADAQAKEQVQKSAEEIARQQEVAAEQERQAKLVQEQEQARIQAEQQRIAEEQRRIQTEIQAELQRQQEQARQVQLQAEQQRQADIQAHQQRQAEIQAEQQRQQEQARQVQLQAEQQRQAELQAEQQRQAELQAEQQRQQQVREEQTKQTELQRQQEEHKKELEAQLKALELEKEKMQQQQ